MYKEELAVGKLTWLWSVLCAVVAVPSGYCWLYGNQTGNMTQAWQAVSADVSTSVPLRCKNSKVITFPPYDDHSPCISF